MGLRQPEDERWFPHYHVVSRHFPGQLRDARSGADLGASVLDVSRDGLGTLLPEPLKEGDQVFLDFAERQIPMVVVHCHEDLIHAGRYRCGLQRRKGCTDNLVSLLASRGMVEPE